MGMRFSFLLFFALTELVAHAELPGDISMLWKSSSPNSSFVSAIEFFDDGTALVSGDKEDAFQVAVLDTKDADTFLLKIKSTGKEDGETFGMFEMKSREVALMTTPAGKIVRMIPDKNL